MANDTEDFSQIYTSSDKERYVLLTTLNKDSYLYKLDRSLSGTTTVIDQETGKPKNVQVGSPLVNDIGRRAILRIAERYMDKDNNIINISQNELRNDLVGLSEHIYVQCTLNYKHWGLSFEDIPEVADMVVHPARNNLSRGVGARELDHVYTETSKQRIEQTADQKQTITGMKRSLFGGDNE